MIRTILFGAGPGAEHFIRNTSQERTFLTIIDNDSSKHGKPFSHLTVIGPQRIDDYAYDEIVITTQWSTDVFNQLTKQLGIPESKVVIPPKAQLKQTAPFECAETAAMARYIISTLSKMAIEQSLPLMVDFGTLLGIVRDGDLITWDDDVDFAIPLTYAQRVPELLDDFIACSSGSLNWDVKLVSNKHKIELGYVLSFLDARERLIPFSTAISFRRFEKGMAIDMPSLGMWAAPENHFKQPQIKNWKGSKVLVPNHCEDYLTYQYGDWRVPIKDMKLSDYQNLNEVKFDQIHAAGIEINRITKEGA